jgi:hypothetical protein
VRGLETKDYKGVKVGNIWAGTDGYVVCPNYAGGIAYDKDGTERERFGWDAARKQFVGGDQHHFDNFVKAVRSRRHEDLTCDIAEGHLSAALCHLANVSYRLGAEAPIGTAEGLYADKHVGGFVGGMLAHLKANKVDVAATKGRFGVELLIDTAKERVGGMGPLSRQANAMLSREYRKGFELKDVG